MTAKKAIQQMIRQTGSPLFETCTDGQHEYVLMKRGVIMRHMILPGQRKDSIRLLHEIREHFPKDAYLLSLLSQYTPFYKSGDYPEINRRITTYEYETVLNTAIELGLTQGYMQKKSSAKEEYTPSFHLEGI